MREASARLVRNLTRAGYQAFSGLPPGTIIIAEEITPADTALMDPTRIGGFAAALGGAEGHTAIMARSLGLPAVLGVADLVGSVRSGDIVAVDGVRGGLVVNPGEATIARLGRRRRALERRERQLARLREVAAVSSDGARVTLQCNIELPNELPQAKEVGAEGIGLLRSEFLYMNREEPPSEDEQYVALKEIVAGMEGAPVTVRTLDVGSDKLAYSLGEHIAPSVNPALGLRAVRLSLKTPALLEAQIAAIPTRRRSRTGANTSAHDHLGGRNQTCTKGRGQDGTQAHARADSDHRCAAARHHDRDAGRGARGRCAGRRLRFLLARYQ